MPSPFPGMNPYLEQDDAWTDFHDGMIPAIRDALSPQVSPNYIVKIEEHIYIHEPAADERMLVGHGDVSVARLSEKPGRTLGGVAVQSPARIRIPSVDFHKHLFLEIRDRKRRELICVLELLSPTNKKPGPDREQYLAKRASLLRSEAHFIEIDLLRGWPRMPMEPLASCDYCIMVSRVEDRPDANFWPLQLRERIPPIPVPLRPPSADVALDLQEILHRVYDAAYYKDYIYQGAPTPALHAEDAAWAAALLGG
jgi:hypothetical protein